MIDAGCLMVFAYVLSRGPQSPKGLTIRLPASPTTSYLLCTYDMTGSCFLPSRCRLIADTDFTDPGVGSRLSASSVVELLIVSRRQFDARERSVDIVTTKETVNAPRIITPSSTYSICVPIWVSLSLTYGSFITLPDLNFLVARFRLFLLLRRVVDANGTSVALSSAKEDADAQESASDKKEMEQRRKS